MAYLSQTLWITIIAAGFVGLAGYFGPWVPHRAAGLVVLGLDLAEYVKFVPEFIAGQVRFPRQVFYLPLLAASVGASLIASRRSLPAWLRTVLAVAALPAGLSMLPPAWSPASLASAEYRLQVLMMLICLVLVPGILLTRLLPERVVLSAIALLALSAALLPPYCFLQIQPAIARVYGHPLVFGWGFWANIGGFLTSAAIAGAVMLPVRYRRTLKSLGT